MSNLLDTVLGLLARTTERIRPWHRWSFIPSIAIVVGNRTNLRKNNLLDTETDTPNIPPPTDFDIQSNRTYDGTFNDLEKPWMGMAGARFGRNVPLANTFGETGDTLMDPNPRLVSNRLMKREKFVPVPHLNVLAAAWIQFMVHDWINHGAPDEKKKHTLPKVDGDDWPAKKMVIGYTKADPETSAADKGKPDTYRNEQTHWWDASQIYGASQEKNTLLRTNPKTGKILTNGKLWLDNKGLLPTIPSTVKKGGKQELSGFNDNWWAGLSVLHTIFVREHNSIVDRLKIDFPDAEGEWLFLKARLVNSALMAKIHTIEWTPALMDSGKGRMLMRGNYWGLKGEQYRKAFGRVSDSEVVSGIPGSPQDHHTAPFSITEEFSSCYRLHSLLPDEFDFRSHKDNHSIEKRDLTGVSFSDARDLYTKMSFDDVVYSLCSSNPGALTMHNYPNGLRHLKKGPKPTDEMDLAAVDILRDRERGVPRFQEFRKLIGMKAPQKFSDITDNRDWQKELKEVYGTVDKVDLLIGTLAESASKNGTPYRFGFSDTVFRIFIVMASRRLKSDRFFTDDFRPEIYTQAGFDWVTNNGMFDVLQRQCPALAPLMNTKRNAFFPCELGR